MLYLPPLFFLSFAFFLVNNYSYPLWCDEIVSSTVGQTVDLCQTSFLGRNQESQICLYILNDNSTFRSFAVGIIINMDKILFY